MKLSILNEYLKADIPLRYASKQLNLPNNSFQDLLKEALGDFYLSLKGKVNEITLFDLYLHNKEFDQKSHMLFIQYFAYSLSLLAAYIGLFLLYELKIFSFLSEQFSFYERSLQTPLSIQVLRLFHYTVICFILLFLIVLFILKTHSDLRFTLLSYLHEKKPSSFWIQYIHHRFVVLWSVLANRGLSSQHIMTILRNKAFPEEVSWLAFHFETSFEQHASLKNHYLDPILGYLLEANHHADKGIFQKYLDINAKRLKQSLSSCAKCFKLCIVFCLALMIYLYYLSFYMPMQFWEGL